MFRHTLKRSLRTLQPCQVFPSRYISGASAAIPNYGMAAQYNKVNSGILNEVRQCQNEIDSLKRGFAAEQHRNLEASSNANSGILNEVRQCQNEIDTLKRGFASEQQRNLEASSNEEVKRLEYKMDVFKTENSFENRKLGTEMNEMHLKNSERIDGLARDILQQKAEFYGTMDTWTKDMQQNIENLHMRMENRGIPQNHQVFVDMKEKIEKAKETETKKNEEDTNKTQTTGEGDGGLLLFSVFIWSIGIGLCIMTITDYRPRLPFYKESFDQVYLRERIEKGVTTILAEKQELSKREKALKIKEEDVILREQDLCKGNPALFTLAQMRQDIFERERRISEVQSQLWQREAALYGKK